MLMMIKFTSFFLSAFLYPSPKSAPPSSFKLPDDGQYETFNSVETLLKGELKNLIAAGENSDILFIKDHNINIKQAYKTNL